MEKFYVGLTLEEIKDLIIILELSDNECYTKLRQLFENEIKE